MTGIEKPSNSNSRALALHPSTHMGMEQASAGEHIIDVDDETETKKEDAQKPPKPNMAKVEDMEVLQYLEVNPATGLSSKEAAHRLGVYGPNVLETPEEEDTQKRRWINKICLCLKWDPIVPEHKNMMRLMLNPVSWVMLFAGIIASSLYAAGGDRVYLYDSLAITSLLLLNYTSCYVAMRKVRNDKAPLIGALKPKAKVLRDGRWREEDPAKLVPGDIIFLKWGDIVPADVRIFDDYGVETECGFYAGGLYKKMVYYQESLITGEGLAVVVATGHDMSRPSPNCFGRAGQLRRGAFTAGVFCILAVVIGTFIELGIIGCHVHLILLIGGLPMAMPAVFYLCLSHGSHKLSRLGIASRGTVGLEDLASVDTVFFNITGTLTLNQPSFDTDKIEVFSGMEKGDAILTAVRTNPRVCDLHQDAIDAAFLSMLSNPDEAKSGIRAEKMYNPYDYYRKKSSRSFLLKDGCYCRAMKGVPGQIMYLSDVSDEARAKITEKIAKLAQEGYESLAIAREDSPIDESTNQEPKLVALMPYKDELREDSADTIRNLTEMGMRVIILTAGESPVKKTICDKLGVPETDVYSYEDENNVLRDGLLSKANPMAITEVYRGRKEGIVNFAITEMGYKCAFIGGGKHDASALEQSHVAIAGPVASDAARRLSDLVFATSDLSPLVTSAQISRVASERMASYLIYAVSSTAYILGILVILLIRRGIFSYFLVLLLAFFNYGFGFAFLGGSRTMKSPVKWRVRNMVATGFCFGCFLCFSSAIFHSSLNFFHDAFNVRPLSDDEKKSALFLQVSIANQAIVFLARCRLVDYPGHSIFGAFSLFQTASTFISVYGDMGFDGVKGIGWGWAALVWIYNCLLMLGLAFIKFSACYFVEKTWSWIRVIKVPYLPTIFFLRDCSWW